MTSRALILAPFSDEQLERLRERLHVDYESWLETRRLTDPDELAARLDSQDVAILVVESDFVFEDVFRQAPRLRFVGVCRNATNHVDIDAATRHGVLVANTPARNAQAVAEHALGLMLALARGTAAAHIYVTEGHWKNPAEPYISMRGVELAGRTLGVIGLGAVGRRLAQMGSALGMEVVAHDPYITSASEAVLTSLDSLMAESDFISLHAPLTAETEGLLDTRALSMLKPTAFVVNTSDAALIDQRALVSALTEKRIAGAALDVFETHPIAPDNPLLSLDNVVLTPHLGGATEETVERHSSMMTDDILRFLDGQRPEHLVNTEAWHRGR
ncbi:MAG: 3-phosphoglycerate dehydrogenase [Chloroflexi bacterium]|nr:3-phosphoglycerate dehydrogenase [Chloroflexota bacterium]